MICQSRGSARRVLRSLNSIPHFLALVKGFLKSFSKKFAVFLLVHQPPLFWPLFDSLHIIALLFLFVKRFFASFFTLETIAVCHKNVVAVLCKLTAIAFLHRKISPPPEGEGLPYRHLTISALQARYRPPRRRHQRSQASRRHQSPTYTPPYALRCQCG